MNACLRCKKPCEVGSVFCNDCRLFLKSQLWERERGESSESRDIASLDTLSSLETEHPEWINGKSDPLERISSSDAFRTQPHTLFEPEDSTLPLPSALVLETASTVEEQTLSKLNEAAQYIAPGEQKTHRLPRASRLAPLRDISTDIERKSTPLPRIQNAPTTPPSPAKDSESGEPTEDLGKRLPDLWPWLQESESEESPQDVWANSTDPLMARHFPSSSEIASLEEEDMRRAQAEGVTTAPLGAVSARKAQPVRRIFAVLAVLAAIALLLDGVLATFVFIHPHQGGNGSNVPPSLTLSTNAARLGQSIILHIRHFSPATHVVLSHDIEEPVTLTSGSPSPFVSVGASGSADVTMLIDRSWGPGFHTIAAEDVSTRYTASATLQITGSGTTSPSHLQIGSSSLDMGSDIEGANTIKQLTLSNTGGGSISWAASRNSPWLLVSPPQGMFSDSQTISVAVQRANLAPKSYTGKITFSSNVGGPQTLEVDMIVTPLPNGAVLQVTPALLSFTAIDGDGSPNSQMLTISNPGTRPLQWTLASNKPVSMAMILDPVDMPTNWLSLSQTSGTIAPHGTSSVSVIVNSSALLPNVYSNMLVFTANSGTYNNMQNVGVSLTIQPRCGLSLSLGSISFTAVSGQTNPSNRSVTLSTTSSCNGSISWKAIASAGWLTITPGSGQFSGTASAVTSVGVNTAGLQPNTTPYTGSISLVESQGNTTLATTTLAVQLTVQPAPPPSAPIMGAAPTTVNFNTTQGMPNPPGQLVTITNTGKSPLRWSTQVNILASQWLGVSPTGGTIPAGSNGQVTILINTSSLTPTNYMGTIILNGADSKGNAAAGSPQTVTVNLVVAPACTLNAPSASSLDFSATQGQVSSPQQVTITAAGNCGWPLNWNAATADSTAGWLNLSQSSTTLANAQTLGMLTVSASAKGLSPGSYTTTIAITGTDSSNNAVQQSPRNVSVNFTVSAQCTLKLAQNNLSFTATAGQNAPGPQSVAITEGGSCVYPISFAASSDSSWLGVSLSSSTDTNGSGSSASISISAMPPGTYTGTITISAGGNGGANIARSPGSISVTFIVNPSFTVSGTVMACVDSACTSSVALPGANVVLNAGSANPMTVTTDVSGNFSFSNVASGTYTVKVTGILGSTSYGNNSPTSITVNGNQTNVVLKVFPI